LIRGFYVLRDAWALARSVNNLSSLLLALYNFVIMSISISLNLTHLLDWNNRSQPLQRQATSSKLSSIFMQNVVFFRDWMWKITFMNTSDASSGSIFWATSAATSWKKETLRACSKSKAFDTWCCLVTSTEI